MNRIILIGVWMMAVCLAHAQTLIVTDQETGQPVIGATVQSENPKASGITDATGSLELGAFASSEAIHIRSIGYQPKTLAYQVLADQNFQVQLLLTGVALHEVVVSASKFEEVQEDVVQKIQVIRKSELQQMNQTSMADVIALSGNVMVQKSQLGGGSPIIRGFETNRVLLVVDGVRMNNAIYRGGHLQNVVTLDNAIMDRVEVVFGPGSVMYGSDALGGVLHFYTKNPTLAPDNKLLVLGNAYQRYSSAANALSSHADLSVGGKKWGSLSSITFSKYDNLKQGSNRRSAYPDFGKRDFYVKRVYGVDSTFINSHTNNQVGSGYSQYDLLQKILYKPNTYSEHVLNVQYSTSSHVPRYDRLTQVSGGNPRFAEWYYGPQKRLFSAYSYTNKKANSLYDVMRTTVGYQQIEESRIDRRYRSTNKNNRTEAVAVATANVDLYQVRGEHEFRYGVEATWNYVASSAFQKNIETGVKVPLDTRYPNGGSNMYSLAGYFTHTWEINEQLVLNEGVRLSYVGLKAQFDDQTFFPFPFNSIKQNHAAPSGNIGLAYSPGADWRITTSLSSGFRAPNVDDLSKVFESVQGRVVVPNPNLKAEYTLNAEVGISKTFAKRVTTSLTGYYTALKYGLTVLPFTFNGRDSILYDGQLSQVTTTKNASEAYIYGLEAGLGGNLTDYLSVRGSVNYTYGRIKTDSSDYPLDHIPPVFGKLQAQLNTGKWRNEVFTQFSGWKKVKNYNLIGEDNFSYATTDGMPAWMTLNARTTWSPTDKVSLQIACENILDQNYRVFASNISAPGRNWVVTLRVNI